MYKKQPAYWLHGWGATPESLHALQKLVPQLSDNTPPLPGFEKELSRPWTMDDYVYWFNQQVDQPSWIIGHSFGGRIALEWAARFPTKAKGLILIAPSGGKRLWYEHLWCLLARGMRHFFHCIGCIEQWRRWMGSSDYHTAHGFLRATLHHVLATDTQSAAAQVQCPVLGLVGALDRSTPPRKVKNLLQKTYHKKVVVLHGMDHYTPLHQGRIRTAQEILTWITPFFSH